MVAIRALQTCKAGLRMGFQPGPTDFLTTAAGAKLVVDAIRRKPRKLAVALALLLITIGVQAQTNSAAFLAGMAQARANVIAATTLSPSDAINPMLAGLFLGSAPATNAVTGNPVTAPLPPGANFYTTDFIYPADMTNYSWTLQRSTDFKKTWVNWMTWPKGLKAGGTMTITSTNPSEFYRMAGN